ncbi:MAG TPA: GNAT family N-acetyltransferase [Streptosporangiaceae bacterium]|nr:GNAT family N-acetyltransferase [Streptosporangiaceae bacterium]
MSMAQAAAHAYALLADGSTVEIRPAGPPDFDAVKAMHEAMSPDNLYLRFFNFSRLAAETEAQRICREPRPGHVALLALSAGEVVGCASYDALGGPAGPGPVAEVAFAVADHMHHRGIATLLLEHLVSYARSHQITVFTAQTLSENTPMLKVFADAGLPVQRHYEDGVMDITIPLPSEVGGTALDSYLNAVAEREGRADTESLRHVLAPQSVAVIGASRRRGTVGRAILDNVIAGGYSGRVYVVNSRARQISGEHCLASVLDLPEPADLAVIAVPAAAVLDVAEQCGRRGVRSLAVITSGLDTAACADLLAVCRRHGMRLVGPDCFGVAVPAIGLDATFAARHPQPGVAGLVMQSGGLGMAMVDQLSRLGIGISSFASVGTKLDVSSNDMLMWWENDGVTRLAVLYIESFGNPRKFARTARRVAARMPILAVEAGRSPAAEQAAAWPTVAAATPSASRDALYEQAGIITTRGFGELVETTALLASQPVPMGSTVAIVSNVGGAGALAADACTSLGLTVHRPHGAASRRLRTLVPDTGAIGGPVDTTAAISAENFRQCLELVAADDEVDALIAVVLPTAATGDLVAAIQQAQAGVPLAAVLLDQAESVRMIPRTGGDGRIPAYGYPEAAAAALARAARYGAWRTEPRGQVPNFPDIRTEDARTLLRGFFHATLGGGWLPPDKTTELLRCYGVPLAELSPARSEDETIRAFQAVAGPVVLKADVPGLLHKTKAGAVELDLRTEAEVRAAYRRLTGRFGQRQRQVLVQPMIAGGTEVVVGVADDHVFGPLVVFGPGGPAAEVLADHAARLSPLTDVDADRLIGSIRSAPLLRGDRGNSPPDLAALRDLLLRVSRLADDLPEVTHLDLSPVIARPDGVFVVDARIKATPYQPQDPFLRKLR